MIFRRILGSALTAFGILGLAGSASASSHREAPAISFDPAADNTDLWAWVERGSHDKLYVVASWNPLEEPAGGPNFHSFSDEVRYEVHFTRGGTSLGDAVTLYFNFRTTPISRVRADNKNAGPGGGKEFFSQLSGVTQSYTVTKVENGRATILARDVPVAPPNIGPRSQQLAHGEGAVYDEAFMDSFARPLEGGGRTWAGPTDDGFYVDLGGVFDLANLRAKGTAQNNVAGYNAHTIAIELPTTALTANHQAPGDTPSAATTLGVWAASSRQEFTVRGRPFVSSSVLGSSDYGSFNFGGWVQVSRIGLPLINEAVIGLQDKNKYNATSPVTDLANFAAYFLNPVVVRDAEAVGIYRSLGIDPLPDAFKYDRGDIVNTISLIDDQHDIRAIGDVLRVDMAKDSGFPNGRPIAYGAQPDQEQADVTDVLLTVILSKGMIAISDGVDHNDKPYRTSFPWLPVPHRGYDQGHGIPTL